MKFGKAKSTQTVPATVTGDTPLPPGYSTEVIGWTKKQPGTSLTSALQQGSKYTPIMAVKAAPVSGSGGGGSAPNVYIAPAQTNISVPVTTQTTTAVSPVFNVAAGTQGGVSQGGSTGQQATPVSRSDTGQGTVSVPQSPAIGMNSEQVAQYLEQQRREQDALAARERMIAVREAEIRAQEASRAEIEKMRADMEARQAAQVAQPIPGPTQAAPIQPQAPIRPLALPPNTVIPGKTNAPEQAAEPVAPTLQKPGNGVKTGALLAIAAVALLMMSDNRGNHGTAKSKRR